MPSRLGVAAAVALDVLLLLVALPVIAVQVAWRALRSRCRAGLHRLSLRTSDAEAVRRERRALSIAAIVHAAQPAHVSLGQSATAIAASLRAGAYSSVHCCEAFIRQARHVDACINAIRDERFEAALVEAAAADVRLAEWRASGRPPSVLPPLLGVPCTVKEVFALPGLRQTGGTHWHRERRAEEEAPPVARMRKAGCIVLCCTTSPELGMW